MGRAGRPPCCAANRGAPVSGGPARTPDRRWLPPTRDLSKAQVAKWRSSLTTAGRAPIFPRTRQRRRHDVRARDRNLQWEVDSVQLGALGGRGDEQAVVRAASRPSGSGLPRSPGLKGSVAQPAKRRAHSALRGRGAGQLRPLLDAAPGGPEAPTSYICGAGLQSAEGGEAPPCRSSPRCQFASGAGGRCSNCRRGTAALGYARRDSV